MLEGLEIYVVCFRSSKTAHSNSVREEKNPRVTADFKLSNLQFKTFFFITTTISRTMMSYTGKDFEVEKVITFLQSSNQTLSQLKESLQ